MVDEWRKIDDRRGEMSRTVIAGNCSAMQLHF